MQIVIALSITFLSIMVFAGCVIIVLLYYELRQAQLEVARLQQLPSATPPSAQPNSMTATELTGTLQQLSDIFRAGR